MGPSLGLLMMLAVADGGARERAPSLLPPVIAGKPAEAAPSYPLRSVQGGGYEYQDTRFKAKIARDGRVSFDDRHGSLVFSLLPIWPQPHPEGTSTLEGSVREMFGKRRRPAAPPPRNPKAEPPQVTARGAPPSEIDRKWNAETAPLSYGSVKGTMDLTDEYLRLMGEDPYRREKARFLAATFDMRVGMAARAEAQDLRQALFALPDRLTAIWRDRAQPAPARRRIICALWTELGRDGQKDGKSGNDGKDKAVDAARVIETFVRTHLPAGSPDAYTPQELSACSAGGPRFSPYATP
jgi:hypothetical protein